MDGDKGIDIDEGLELDMVDAVVTLIQIRGKSLYNVLFKG